MAHTDSPGLLSGLLGRIRRSPGVDDAPPPAVNAPATDAEALGVAMDALPDPVLIVASGLRDESGGRSVRYANPAARRFLRISTVGAPLTSALRDPEVLEAVEEALAGAPPRAIGYESGGAQPRQWKVWTAPLPAGPDGARALVHLRDETDARRAEKMRVDFLANASHELRTPLASLLGFIETLKGPARDDEEARAKFLDIMAVQAERMGRLIADLLSLSRIEMNEHVPPSASVDLASVVADVVDASTLLAAARGVRLTIHRTAEDTTVLGDRDQLIQVVQNLIDNAVKYSPPEAEVDILLADAPSSREAARHSVMDAHRMSLVTPDLHDTGAHVLLAVRDRGPGLEREHMPRLTERFYRVEGQKSGERLGTGLGLAIVKHIVNRHRGGVTVESAPGQGSIFSVYFPIVAPSHRGERAL